VVVYAVAVVELELFGDAEGAAPLDEFEFDPDAIGVPADAASAACKTKTTTTAKWRSPEKSPLSPQVNR
jgi:HEAT repeat protein